MSNEIRLWQGPNGIQLPVSIKDPNQLVTYANNLTEKQQMQIVKAFKLEAFDMAAEFAWKKAMVKLKETISTLGMKFIGEMLGREEIDQYTPIEAVLTDYLTIQLAEQLGVIGTSAALKLKHANELITHYFSNKADEEIDYSTAFQIVKSSVQYVLGEQDISIALEFSEFRERLLNDSINRDDPQIDQVINSPLFYIRTINTILLSAIKSEQGAKLEHSLANFNLLIPLTWDKIGESDKWNIGTVYRDVTASGKIIAAVGLKNALLKVKGFDYVPENLRSSTFKDAAKKVIEIHFAINNFYNELAVVQRLASLGSSIPSPAFIECIQAYLAVYLGNCYGVSFDAAPIAKKELAKITPDRWQYYFAKAIHYDDIVLVKLMNDKSIERFSVFLDENRIIVSELPKFNMMLYNAIIARNIAQVQKITRRLYNKIKE